jgi:hypothetical protein
MHGGTAAPSKSAAAWLELRQETPSQHPGFPERQPSVARCSDFDAFVSPAAATHHAAWNRGMHPPAEGLEG